MIIIRFVSGDVILVLFLVMLYEEVFWVLIVLCILIFDEMFYWEWVKEGRKFCNLSGRGILYVDVLVKRKI